MTHFRVIPALALGTALTLVACGGGEESSSSAPAAERDSAAAPARPIDSAASTPDSDAAPVAEAPAAEEMPEEAPTAPMETAAEDMADDAATAADDVEAVADTTAGMADAARDRVAETASAGADAVDTAVNDAATRVQETADAARDTVTETANAGAETVAAASESVFALGDAAEGRRLFTVCAACHTIEEGAPNRVGPNLWGVVGRQSASLDGFAYSNAMQSANLTWTPEQLDAYLEAPQEVVPGTRMAYPGMKDATDRANLIAWLAEQQ